jgi:FkbM family methyltransferase
MSRNANFGRVILSRFLTVGQHLNRLPEILRCRRNTRQWLTLTSAYIGLNAHLPFKIDTPSGTFEFREIADIATFWQIFYREVYPVTPSDRLIVDAGANIGAFSLFALQTAPHANVIAVEPAPDSCSRIRSMLQANKFESRCILHEVALGNRSGETTIQLDTGSQFRRTGVAGHRVAMETLDSLIPPAAVVDLMKIDVERAEYEVLHSVSPSTLRRIRKIVMEFHPNAPSERAILPLTSSGFTVSHYQDHGEGYGVVWLDRDATASSSNFA